MTPVTIFGALALLAFFALGAVAWGAPKADDPEGSTDMSTIENYSDKVKKFAEATWFAEGYMDRHGIVHADSRPARNNNPGDFLGSGDDGSDGIYAKYSSIAFGKVRSYMQWQMAINGTSKHYRLDMTISDAGYSYTATEQDAWGENVASYLGVTRDTKLQDVLV